MVEDGDKEKAWLEELVNLHPVFSSLPLWIKDELGLKPGYQEDLPLNRHARKRMKGEMVRHLFAGPKEGFTFKNAMEEVNGEQRRSCVGVGLAPRPKSRHVGFFSCVSSATSSS